jgi:hypothetical protein
MASVVDVVFTTISIVFDVWDIVESARKINDSLTSITIMKEHVNSDNYRVNLLFKAIIDTAPTHEEALQLYSYIISESYGGSMTEFYENVEAGVTSEDTSASCKNIKNVVENIND